MSEKKDSYTVKEIADRFDVVKRVAAGWIEQGKFPGAKKAPGTFGQDYWLVPAAEVESFVPQQRRGKPHAAGASKAAVNRRGRRSKVVAA